MKKIFLTTFMAIFFIGCLEPSQERLDSNWVKSVKGKTFIASDDYNGFIIFDDFGGISYADKNINKEDASTEQIIGELLVENFLNFKFSRSHDKKKGIYEIKFLFMTEYVGFSIDGKNLYMHSGESGRAKIPDDINWDFKSGIPFSLYKGK